MKDKKEENTKFTLIVFAVLLIGFTAVQAVEINQIEDKLETLNIAVESGESVSIQRTAPERTAPTMVGGC